MTKLLIGPLDEETEKTAREVEENVEVDKKCKEEAESCNEVD